MGIAHLALAWLLQTDRATANPQRMPVADRQFDTAAKPPHQPGRATAMISLWMQGGPSHLDLFDPKPELTRCDGMKYTGDIKYDNAAQASATLLASPWKFRPRGTCGTELSELLPQLGEVVDDICLIRSMHTGVNNHFSTSTRPPNFRAIRRPATSISSIA